MNPFDRSILEFFNRFSQQSWTFDHAMFLLTETELLKGGVVVANLWVLWFTRDKEGAVTETRRTIIATFAGTFIAVFLGVILANALPYRLRPLHHPRIDFRLPFGITTDILGGWSSFPSDHATLFSGLFTGTFLISLRLGFLSIFYVFLVVLIPRIYLGFHYPTDILAGILIGCVCVLLANRSMIKIPLTDPVLEWSEKHPGLFYGLFFLVSYQVVDLFEDIREVGSFLLGVALVVVQRIS